MTDKTVIVVGASRGLGLGLAQEYRARGWRVIATVRGQVPPGLDDVRVERLDITDAAGGQALAERLAGTKVDLLFVNAGVMSTIPYPDGTTEAEIARVFATNSIAPVRLARQLLRLIVDGGTIAFMSSQVGSIQDNGMGGMELYRASKAALNSLVRSFAVTEIKRRQIAVLSLHPGWVKTDMGGGNAPLTVAESVKGLADVTEREAGQRGHRFLDYAGKTIPW